MVSFPISFNLVPVLGQQHIPAVRIFHGLLRNRFHGMPVDYHVDSPGIANNVVGSPAVRDAVLPQMPNQNHVIRARIPGRIYRILNLIVQALPLSSSQKP